MPDLPPWSQSIACVQCPRGKFSNKSLASSSAACDQCPLGATRPPAQEQIHSWIAQPVVAVKRQSIKGAREKQCARLVSQATIARLLGQQIVQLAAVAILMSFPELVNANGAHLANTHRHTAPHVIYVWKANTNRLRDRTFALCVHVVNTAV